MAYNTGNPVGSRSPKDLLDNSENLDELVNSPTKTEHPDRLGVDRKTWHGMEVDFQQFLAGSAYQPLGDYDTDGPFTVEYRNQVFVKDGEYYRAAASTTLPYSTTDWATDESKFVGVGDAVLRQDLAAPGGAFLVKDAVAKVADVTELRALTGMVDGQVVDVAGRDSGSDGLGFQVVIISGSQPDDGKNYFELADGKRAKFSGSTIRQSGVSGDNITANPEFNDIVKDVSACTISGGGNVSNQNLVGWDQPYEEYDGDGSTTDFVFPHQVDLISEFTVTFVRADGVRVNVGNFTATGLGTASATVTYPESGTNTFTGNTELTADERLLVSGKKVAVAGSGADYSTIYGGYDNIVNRLMSQCSGAHHRITGGDHNSVFGGSYHRIDSGAYGIIAGGSSSRIHGSANAGCGVFGGLYADVSGVTSGSFVTTNATVSGSYSTVLGGNDVTVTGNGAYAAGRTVSVTAVGSTAFGESLSVASQYSNGFGLGNNVTGGGFSFTQGRDNEIIGSYSFVAATRDAQVYHSYSSCISGEAGKSRASGQTIHSISDSTRRGRKQVTRTLFEASTTGTTSTSGALIDGTTTVVSDANKVFMYQLTVTARGSNSAGAVFVERGAYRNDSGTLTAFGTPIVESFVESSLGDIDATIDLSGSGVVGVTFSPRTTATVPTEWFAELEVHEVGS